MVYKNPSKVVAISEDALRQIKDCLIAVNQELKAAEWGSGWICNAGVETEIHKALETVSGLLRLNAQLNVALERALENAKQQAGCPHVGHRDVS